MMRLNRFWWADVKASRMPREKCNLKSKHIERWAKWWRSAWTVFFAAPYVSRKVEATIKRVTKERLEKQKFDDAKCNRLRLSSQIQGVESEYYSNSICRWLPFICRFAWSFEMLRRLEKMRHSAWSHVDLRVRVNGLAIAIAMWSGCTRFFDYSVLQRNAICNAVGPCAMTSADAPRARSESRTKALSRLSQASAKTLQVWQLAKQATLSRNVSQS